MKVGIIGAGFVGATTAYAIVMRGVASDIVLVDIDEARAKAEASDVLHAVPFAHSASVTSGEYADLEGSDIVVITAGANQKPGETRLELLGRNAKIMEQVVPQAIEYAPGAVLIVVSNPVDVMTHLAARTAAEHDVPPRRVIGAGTMLDTARFRALLGEHLGVDPQHVHGYVVGEHGDSEVLTWSIVDVGGLPLQEYARLLDIPFDKEVRQRIDDEVRNAAYEIIEGKGATYYGIGSALAHLIEVVGHDHRGLLTVCSPLAEMQGVKDVTLSVPHLLGGEGSLATLPLRLSDEENEALQRSARVIRDAIDKYDASR
jgi:L-lactate dehydrogenase